MLLCSYIFDLSRINKNMSRSFLFYSFTFLEFLSAFASDKNKLFFLNGVMLVSSLLVSHSTLSLSIYIYMCVCVYLRACV